jgi:hypothetical protein
MRLSPSTRDTGTPEADGGIRATLWQFCVYSKTQVSARGFEQTTTILNKTVDRSELFSCLRVP